MSSNQPNHVTDLSDNARTEPSCLSNPAAGLGPSTGNLRSSSKDAGRSIIDCSSTIPPFNGGGSGTMSNCASGPENIPDGYDILDKIPLPTRAVTISGTPEKTDHNFLPAIQASTQSPAVLAYLAQTPEEDPWTPETCHAKRMS